MHSWLWELYAVISFLVFLWVNEERSSLPVHRATSGKPRNWVLGAVVFMCCRGQAACTHAVDPALISNQDLSGNYTGAYPSATTGSSLDTRKTAALKDQHGPNCSKTCCSQPEPGSPGGECQLWHGSGNKAWGGFFGMCVLDCFLSFGFILFF